MTFVSKRPLKQRKPTKGDQPLEGAAGEENDRMLMRQKTVDQSKVVEGEGLDARLQAQIGQKLRAMFDEVASAPIPDKFLELLTKLDGKEPKS